AWLPPGTVLDGELVSWNPQTGRTDFAALGRRITAGRGLGAEAAANPVHLVAFDCLAERGTVLLRRPLAERRQHLEQLLAGAPAALSLCAQTDDPDEARAWMADYAPAGIEGIVSKPAASVYTPGRAGWVKVKTRASVEALIGGVTGRLDHPSSLLLARYDARGGLRYVGRTHQLPAAVRAELDGLLLPADRQVWPVPLPARWAGDLTDPKPVPYVPVEPLVVVEVAADVAYEHGRWRHRLRALRVRPDLDPAVLPLWTLDAGSAA
ncbi:ATP-dependent DNA ligase, partial [Catenuloplanes indicus]